MENPENKYLTTESTHPFPGLTGDLKKHTPESYKQLKSTIGVLSNEKRWDMTQDTSARHLEVIRCRRAGDKWSDVAQKTNYSVIRAKQIWKEYLDENNSLVQEERNLAKQEELSKLDLLEADLYSLLDPSSALGLQTYNIKFKIMEHRAKLLGLYEAVKTESKIEVTISHEERLRQLDEAMIDGSISAKYIDITNKEESNDI